MDSSRVERFRALANAFGPSGFEREVAALVKEAMQGVADEVTVDKLGSILFTRRGAEDHPRVLIAGHIDEVGFIVSGITKEGYLKFNPLGGWFSQVLLGQRVIIRTRKGEKLPGVIAAKPPHLLKPEEQKKVVELGDMFIDVGATSKGEVEDMGIRIGDPIVPDSAFTLIRGGGIAMGKAFDDRVGAFIAMEVVRQLKEKGITHPNTVIGASTVQEEVGLRGARTTAHLVEPEVAFIAEVDIAGDVPGIKPEEAPAKLGKGPSLVTMDRTMIPNQPLLEFVMGIAEKEGIPYQLSQVARGGTDGGPIHLNRAGCPTLVIGVPTRHIHSHVSILSLEDVDNAVKLLVAAVKKLDMETVKGFTAL